MKEAIVLRRCSAHQCWRMPGYLPARQAPATAMRSGPWKLIENYEDGSLELYNLVNDIRKTTC